ncbi:MAG: GEVED domain-containing protein [Bacteroidota bacterium]
MKPNFFNLKFIIQLLLVLFPLLGLSQTTIINSATVGGFESGATFATNGWTNDAPGNATRNQWETGTGATGYTGARSAYITNAAASSTHAYTLGTVRQAHFYRDITITAGHTQIALSFNWKGQGESTDKLSVWVVPTSVTPAYGTAITASGSAPTGNVKISGDLYAQAAWTTASFNLPASYAGTTVRLVFEWVNDGSGGTQPPAAVDNISLISNIATGHCTYSTSSSTYWISNFTTTGGFANINNNSTYSAGGYANYYPTLSVSQIAGGNIGFSMNHSSGTHGVNIWVDWNNDFDFGDVGEKVYASGSYVSNATGNFTVPGGTAVGNYRLRMVSDYLNTNPAECGTSTYTEAEDYMVSVVTPPSCFTPIGITAAATSLTTGTASWSAPTSGTPPIGYEYVISTVNTIPGGAGTATVPTTLNFTGLTSNTTYYVFVRSNCGAGDFSSWTSASFFTGYCSSTSSGSSYFINNFSTTGGTANITNNGSGYSATGYGNFSAMTVSQQQFGTVNFSTALTGGTFGFNIWVDWNNDLDFNDTGELVYIAGTYVSTATGSFTVPATATVGNHRMRIVANYNSTNPLACGAITSGETEDYTFTVLASTCPGIPTAVIASVTSTTAATINWTAASPAPANGYQIYLTTSATLPTGATTPTHTTAAGITTLSLTGLTANTTYYVYVRNNCGSGNVSPWTTQVSFFTGYCASTSSSSTYFINNFSTTGGTANITNNGSGYSATGYGNFTGQTVSQQNFGAVSFSSAYTGGSSGFAIWVDWNNDLDFDDVGELMYSSGTYATTNTGSFTVPGSATVGNHRMRIRSNYLSTNPDECGSISSGETEDYTFTVLAPPACATNPTSITVFLNSQTSATVSWTAPTPAPTSGYQYYLSTSSATPAGAATPTGSTVTAVTSATLTGLTSGTTYYIWVRSNCGGGTGVGVWIGPTSFTMPTCTIGPGTGTTALACPDVMSGGLGLSGSDPAPVTCGAASTCVDLEASYLQIGETTSYTVQSITYAPPYQFNCLRNPVSVNIDDRWSPVINLPFDFCFYGNNYNQCLMSSNGVITFDTTSNTPGGYSNYSFSNNLPSTSLFTNAIFGVYHDIDPSISGEVGWELITLNTGCRALVASWSDIPMFSSTCNSQLYTGMMVLYENTNIIEVYIKEKNVCASWNGGNAVVGIQNAAGTQAVVPAGRNSLDTDWTVSNQAFRFTPSGAAISTVTWYEGSGTAGPIVGSSDVINVCPATTTTYTAEIEYTLCNGSSLIETDEVTVTVAGNKIWDGSTSTNWNDATNWTPAGVPVSTDCVVIPDTANDPIIGGASFSGLGRSLAVNANATLNITATNAVTITDVINVNSAGTIIVQDDASIVQVNNVANVGNIQYKRTANIRKQDYVYWSSPVSGFASTAVSPGTSLGYQYKWTPTIATNTNGFGNWVLANETMVRGKGYCLRGPDSYSLTALTNYTATLTGVPNNGNITIPISRGTYNTASTYSTGVSTTLGTRDDDNWNLVGNPYPSAIHAINFLTLNTNIAGFVNIWTHGTLPSNAIADPFYADYAYNYTPTDYITYNAAGASSGPGVFNGRIAGGQGFFVSMLHTSAAATENLNFNNTLRSNTYNNTVFYKNSDNNKTADELEKHRIWFDLVTPSGTSIRSLLGYIENATNGEDRLFDAFSNEKLSFNIFSLIDEEPMLIQGRKLPFDINDKVKIGATIPQDGLYKIALSTVDGLFLNPNQNIYLEDKLLNVIFNLKDAPYSFMANKGTIKDRFTIRYTKENNITEVTNQLTVYDNNVLTVESGKLKIKDVVIYDTLGKLLLNKKNVNDKDYQITNLNRTNSMLIVKVTLEDNTEEVRKIIY